ncbi:CDP-glycerol glycerophosphotransferase family protein [Castellaniella hirudinis]|uniref:CDP-glycerol glycerophosphotransferase family protein n=1 Tax=Castellaniella hirudinis TaxID=1144617 RepID=UPI0039C3AF70
MPSTQTFGFLLHSPELINHFGPVWSLLPAGSFEIVLIDTLPADILEATKQWNSPVISADEAIRTNKRYDYLISNHPQAGAYQPPLVQQLGKHNIRFMYAAGKSGWNLSFWNQIYDAILCFGPFHATEFSKICDAAIIPMGYPRFDRFFNEKPNLTELREKYGCNPRKKTIVWLPTWDALSSVGHFDEEIGELARNYNVIVKVHPLMPAAEPHRVKALARQPFTTLITTAQDNLPLYQLADYMIFDYGGPPMAALYTDKNFLLLNVPGASKDPCTGENSPDIYLRQHFKSIEAGAADITKYLEDEALWDEQKKTRSQLRPRYFSPYFGFSSVVAAQALLNMEHIIAHRKVRHMVA